MRRLFLIGFITIPAFHCRNFI